MWGEKNISLTTHGRCGCCQFPQGTHSPSHTSAQSCKHRSALVQLVRVSTARSAGPAAMSRRQALDGGCSDSAREGSEPVLQLCSSTPRNKVCSGREARENTLVCCALTLIKKRRDATHQGPTVAFSQPQALLGVSLNCYSREKKIIICLWSKYRSTQQFLMPRAGRGWGSAHYPCEPCPQKCSRHALKGVVRHDQAQHFRGQWLADFAVALGQQGAPWGGTAQRSSVQKVFQVSAALIRDGLVWDGFVAWWIDSSIMEELLLPSEQGHVLMTQEARMFPRGNLPCEKCFLLGLGLGNCFTQKDAKKERERRGSASEPHLGGKSLKEYKNGTLL